MTFNWEEYLTVAKNCVDLQDEAHARTAVSRSYYAAFGVAYANLTERERIEVDSRSGEGGSHDKVWAFYNQEPATNRGTIGSEGRSFKSWRKLADYASDYYLSPHEAENAIDRAWDLIGDIKAATE
jgi:uncharacterized protein (UPF0332 family)